MYSQHFNLNHLINSFLFLTCQFFLACLYIDGIIEQTVYQSAESTRRDYGSSHRHVITQRPMYITHLIPKAWSVYIAI